MPPNVNNINSLILKSILFYAIAQIIITFRVLMTSFIQSLLNITCTFNPFQQETQRIDRSLAVNLEKDYQRYSFLVHHPEEQQKINDIFQMTIQDKHGVSVSVDSLLQKNQFFNEDLDLLEALGFSQLSLNTQGSIVLEHPSFQGWLIKKNYGFANDVHGKSNRISKFVSGSNFPSWMLPPDLRNVEQDEMINIAMPNDIIHPLRVVMLKRGRQWIKYLKLTHIKAVKEYLYELPKVSSAKRLYERVVVISQKADILDESANLHRFADMAIEDPKRLMKIVDEIVLLIKCWKLTDTHLHNFRFLDDDTDTLIAIDGEPIGALADASEPRMVESVRSFNPGFYSLLGLKKLEISIYEKMEEEGIESSKIEVVQTLFHTKITVAMNEIIQQSAWSLIKKTLYESSYLLNLASTIHRNFITASGEAAE